MQKNTIVLVFSVIDASSINVCIAASGTVDASSIMKSTMSMCGGRGGGRSDIAMGAIKLINSSMRDECVANLENSFLSAILSIARSLTPE